MPRLFWMAASCVTHLMPLAVFGAAGMYMLNGQTLVGVPLVWPALAVLVFALIALAHRRSRCVICARAGAGQRVGRWHVHRYTLMGAAALLLGFSTIASWYDIAVGMLYGTDTLAALLGILLVGAAIKTTVDHMSLAALCPYCARPGRGDDTDYEVTPMLPLVDVGGQCSTGPQA